jgi:hypothetical protein
MEVIAEGKKLEYVLWALAGKVVSVSTPQPIVNAKQKPNGKLEQETSGTLYDQVVHALHKGKPKPAHINMAWVREFAEQRGFSPGSAKNMVDRLRREKLIRKDNSAPSKGVGARYVVLPAK